jgi:excisionase family DNA binding protein
MDNEAIVMGREELRTLIREAMEEHAERPEPLMTTEQAAAYLQVDVNTVRIWARDTDDPIPHVSLKSSRQKRFRRKDLDAWMSERARR